MECTEYMSHLKSWSPLVSSKFKSIFFFLQEWWNGNRGKIVSTKYSLQRNKLHPIKGIFHIVLFLAPQGNLKEQKEKWLNNLGRNIPLPFPSYEGKLKHTNSLSATNFMYWLMSVEFMPISAQGRASHTNSISIWTASCTILWTRSESSGLSNKLQAIAMHWLIINPSKSYQSSKTNMTTSHP